MAEVEKAMGIPCAPSEFSFDTRSGERRTIRAIPRVELPAYRLLGSGANVSFGLCFFSGVLHCTDFEERVAGYLVRPDKNAVMLEEIVGTPYLSVDFFEVAKQPLDFRPVRRMCPACEKTIDPDCAYCHGSGIRIEPACVYGGWLHLDYREGGTCPQCGRADEVVPITYGLDNDTMRAAARAGLTVCGGCELHDDSASSFCKACGIEFRQ